MANLKCKTHAAEGTMKLVRAPTRLFVTLVRLKKLFIYLWAYSLQSRTMKNTVYFQSPDSSQPQIKKCIPSTRTSFFTLPKIFRYWCLVKVIQVKNRYVKTLQKLGGIHLKPY